MRMKRSISQSVMAATKLRTIIIIAMWEMVFKRERGISTRKVPLS